MTDNVASAAARTSPSVGVALLVSNHADTVRQVSESAAQLAIAVEVCAEPAEAVRLLNHRKFEAVIVDLGLGQQGYNVLEHVRLSHSNQTAVTFSITSDNQEAALALKTGSKFVMQRPLISESIDRTFRVAYGLIVRELRRYFRCSLLVPAVLRSLEAGEIQCETFDISEGGMGISTPRLLEPGIKLTAQFTLPGQDAFFAAAADLCWCNSKGRVGLRFLHLSSSQKSEVQDWLSRRLEQSLPEEVAEQFRKTPG